MIWHFPFIIKSYKQQSPVSTGLTETAAQNYLK